MFCVLFGIHGDKIRNKIFSLLPSCLRKSFRVRKFVEHVQDTPKMFYFELDFFFFENEISKEKNTFYIFEMLFLFLVYPSNISFI